MAMRAVGQPSIVEAGIFMIRSEDPAQWDAITEAARFEVDNRDALARCKQAAKRAKASTNCIVRIGT
jgi:hypothetical protein